MIGYLNGTLFESDGHQVIVLVHGVGYKVRVIDGDKIGSQASDNQISLYTHTHVREDELSLYGFKDKRQLKLFELLITVSGVGPKMAMNVLAKGNPEQIQKAVAEADVGFFTSVSGIGKKNGQRIIVDLKSKLGSIKDLEFETDGDYADDIAQGLIGMGFDGRKVNLVLAKIDRTLSESDQIKQALKLLKG